ncbi:ATP-binding protein [Parabacteroides sp. APC149_11_2_Y6]
MKWTNNIWNYRLIFLLQIAWAGTLLPVFAQTGLPFFQNFTSQDYSAHNRNFDVVCDSSGIAYFANFEGIIYFNGAEWNKILTPGISRITRLYADNNNYIWAGGHNYIGKIAASINGTPVLKTFISDDTKGKNNIRIGEVLRIMEKGDSLLFYTQRYKISIRNDSISSMENLSVKNIETISTKPLQLSKQLQVIINGTSGLSFLDKKGKKLFSMTEENGLCSNTINQIATDNRGSLWGATDNGIFRINTPSFYTHFTPEVGLRGEVTTLYRYKHKFYAGTLHGLFIYNREHSRFEPLPSITQACWQLKESPSGTLYAATSNGLFRINEHKAEAINEDNTFSLLFNPSDPQTIYTGEIDGIYLLKGKKKKKIANIEKVMKLEFANNRFWAETLYGEIYRFNTDFSSPLLQDSMQGLKTSGGNKMYAINQTIYVFSQSGFQYWDENRQRFIKQASPLDSLITANTWWPGLYAETSAGRQSWITGGDGKSIITFTNGKIDKEKSRVLHATKDYTIRALYPEEDGVIWLGGDFGLIKFDKRQPDAAFDRQPDISIRSILLGNDSVYFGGNNTSIEQVGTLPAPHFSSQTKNFKFIFSSVANDRVNDVLYSCYLEGLDSDWGPWLGSSVKEYTNLSFGSYTFHVRMMDAFGRMSEVKSFSFTILKPFYLKWYSLLAYTGVLLLLILLFFKWRTRKLLQEKLHLENLVEERTLQIREQRDEIAEKSQKLETALTELNQAQDQLIQQEKAATVGKLTQGLIDRILNPLNYIINFSHLSTVLLKDMKDDIEDEENKITEENYEDMQDIMKMLNVHLSKIEEHGNSTSRILKAMEEMLSDHSSHFSPVDINKLIHGNLDLLKKYNQKELEKSGIRITFEPLPEMLEIEADQLQIGKVLMNIMQNSIHALQKKIAKTNIQPEIRIRIHVEEGQLFIYLYDNGIGIEESILNKIFDPFFTTKTTSEAAGVGLYLSREILLSHNGTIRVQSEKDEYTEFILSVPIHQPIKSKSNE